MQFWGVLYELYFVRLCTTLLQLLHNLKQNDFLVNSLCLKFKPSKKLYNKFNKF